VDIMAKSRRPVYDEDNLTLPQLEDLVEGRALLRNPHYDPKEPGAVPATLDLTLRGADRLAFDTAIARGWLEIEGPRLDTSPGRLWNAYCRIDEVRRPVAILLTAPHRESARRGSLGHWVRINVWHMGLRLPAGAADRLAPYVSQFIDRRRSRCIESLFVEFFVRDSKLDEFRGFMPALIDMIQEMGVAIEEEFTP
jgi:hypothetical protein